MLAKQSRIYKSEVTKKMRFVATKNKLFLKKLVLIAIVLGLFFAVNNKFLKEKVLSFNKKITEEEVPTKIASINISIPEKDYNFLFSDLPLSNRTFQKGKAIADGQPEVYNIDFRLRGDHGWHWYKEKPSFRIRLSGGKTLYSRKEIDYINPEDPSGFSNVMSSIMATKVEIPHFLMTFSQVYINNEYKGLYLIADKKISTNLKNYDGITGPVVTGDDWDLRIWSDEKVWSYEQGVEESLLLELKEKLHELLVLVQNPLNDSIKSLLSKSLDIDKCAKWSAFMAVIGSVHTDDFHNNCLVYDQNNKKYFPVIADPSGFGTLTSYINKKNEPSCVEQPIYEFLTPLFSCLFRSPEFQYKRNSYIYEYITNKISKDYLKQIATNWRKLIEPLYDIEKNAFALIDVKTLLPIRLPVSAEYRKQDIDRLIEFYDLRTNFLLKQLNECSVNLFPYKINVAEGIKLFVITVKGHSPVSFDTSSLKGKIYADTDLNATISKDEIIASNSLLLYPALKETKDFSKVNTEWLQLLKRTNKYVLVPTAQNYLIGVENKFEKEFLDSLSSSAKNAVTGQKINIKIFDEMKLENDNEVIHSFHCWSKYEKN